MKPYLISFDSYLQGMWIDLDHVTGISTLKRQLREINVYSGPSFRRTDVGEPLSSSLGSCSFTVERAFFTNNTPQFNTFEIMFSGLVYKNDNWCVQEHYVDRSDYHPHMDAAIELRARQMYNFEQTYAKLVDAWTHRDEFDEAQLRSILHHVNREL